MFTQTLSLKPLSRSRSVAGVHVCVRVCVRVCVCYICNKNIRKWINMDNKTGWKHGLKVVSKYKKHKRHWENCQNMVSFFGTIWPPTDPKKVQNWPFSPTHCFHVFPGISRRFWPEVLTQTPQNAVFHPKSYSKGPNHALEKVLTKETPGKFDLPGMLVPPDQLVSSMSHMGFRLFFCPPIFLSST